VKAVTTWLLSFAMWAGQTTQEVVTKDTPATFTAKTNMVTVPVVVRDKNGKAAENLRKEDFQLFDRGKPQAISSFSIVKTPGIAAPSPGPAANPSAPTAPATVPTAPAPDQFIGLLFDDWHTSIADLIVTRQAAEKYVAENLGAKDRVAVFTTSGAISLDFTDDRDKLHQTLAKLLMPHATVADLTPESSCPYISRYMADQIINLPDHDLQGFANIAGTLVVRCMDLGCLPPPAGQPETWPNGACRSGVPLAATQIMEAKVRAIVAAGHDDTIQTVDALTDAIRRMALMPGKRILILASPGFIIPQDELQDPDRAIDLAIRSNVTVDTLDARGLYVPDPFNDSRIPFQLRLTAQQLHERSAKVQSQVLEEIASGTGGQFIHNTNDLAGGFAKLATPPEATYLLGFSPQNLKLDGAFHALKVSVKPGGFNLQARLGYFAPTHLASAEETAREEIREAVFSRDEVKDIRIAMATEFFKRSPTEATLSVVSRIDVSQLHFRKADGRNLDEINFVCALFDRDGVYIDGVSKTISLRLLDDTLHNRIGGGIPIRSDFKVPPGTYAIRLVARDLEGEMMTAQNGAVEIPR
jgi:VWFA-related protein